MSPDATPTSTGDYLLAAGNVVVPSGTLRPGWIHVAEGRLRSVAEGVPPRKADARFDDGWLLPGFVDTHVHGGGGADTALARPDAVAQAVRMHRSHGTTTTVASLVTAELDELNAAVAQLVDMAHDGLIDGIHLEGPWLAPSRCGAHDPQLLRTPTAGDLERLIELGQGHISAITIAPELPGGLEAISQITASGAIAAIGHTEASYRVTHQAIEAGARVATHLFNAMPSIHHREPGPIPALLESEHVGIELILDGVHIHPAVAALAAQRVGPDRTILVTDAMSAAGSPDGEYRLGSRRVLVQAGIARLADNGALAGSTLTMDAAWRFAVQQCALSASDASRAASTTPARLLGLETERGALIPGLRADIVVLDHHMNVQHVMTSGHWNDVTPVGKPMTR